MQHIVQKNLKFFLEITLLDNLSPETIYETFCIGAREKIV